MQGSEKEKALILPGQIIHAQPLLLAPTSFVMDRCQDDLLREILRTVSAADPGFKHGLVSRRWNALCSEAQLSLHLSPHASLPEHVFLAEACGFPNLTSLKVPRDSVQSLTPRSLLALFRCLNGHLHKVSLHARPRSHGSAVHWRASDGQWLQLLLSKNLHLQTLAVSLESSCYRLPPELAALADLETLHLYSWQRLSESRDLQATLCQEAAEGSPPSEEWGLSDVTELPQCLAGLSSLASLRLRSTRLEELPQDLTFLTAITDLRLAFLNLRSLPPGFDGLVRLENLMLESRQLTSLPVGFEKLPCLQHLVLACPRLTRLPENFGELQELRSLELDQCTGLTSIPESVGMLGKLSMLALGSGLGSVQEQSWLALTSLRSLVIRRYSAPVIPAAILALTQIQELYVCSSPAIRLLPLSLGDLLSLEVLMLHDCPGLKELPSSVARLQGLTRLQVQECRSLRGLPSNVCALKRVRSLRLSSLASATLLPDFMGGMEGLRELHISSLASLLCLPANLGLLKSLTELRIKDCRQIWELPGSICHLSNLNLLEVSGCQKMRNLPRHLGALQALTILLLSDLPLLSRLPNSFSALTGLEKLRVSNCPRLVDPRIGYHAIP